MARRGRFAATFAICVAYNDFMVTVFLRGGLGNQMFQYALGLHLAKKNNTRLILDTVHLSDRFPRKNFTYRTFDLDVFTLQPQLTRLSRVACALPIPGLWLGLDLVGVHALEVLGKQKTIYEMSSRFDPAVLRARGNIVLFGRWQSEQYFAEITDEVRAAFRFRYVLEGEAKELREQIRTSNSISLHVRRGDYASFANVKKIMGDTDLSYYSRAVAYVAERVKQPKFFVFSDDIEWCRKNIKLSFPAVYVDSSSSGPKASFHLELMSLCKHNIITNSTFPWWGAWLNHNPQKIVVAPMRWYADPAMKGDVIPAHWIKI